MLGNLIVSCIGLFFIGLFVLIFFGESSVDDLESTRFIEEQEAEVTRPIEDDWVI